MGDVGEDYKLMDKLNKERKKKNLEEASKDGWNLHTKWHWSRTINGKRMDYWPSKRKFQYNGKIIVGDVDEFIDNQ